MIIELEFVENQDFIKNVYEFGLWTITKAILLEEGDAAFKRAAGHCEGDCFGPQNATWKYVLFSVHMPALF